MVRPDKRTPAPDFPFFDFSLEKEVRFKNKQKLTSNEIQSEDSYKVQDTEDTSSFNSFRKIKIKQLNISSKKELVFKAPKNINTNSRDSATHPINETSEEYSIDESGSISAILSFSETRDRGANNTGKQLYTLFNSNGKNPEIEECGDIDNPERSRGVSTHIHNEHDLRGIQGEKDNTPSAFAKIFMPKRAKKQQPKISDRNENEQELNLADPSYDSDKENTECRIGAETEPLKKRILFLRPKVFVFLIFACIVLGTIVGYFVWPRTPSITVTQISPLNAATITYDRKNSKYGLQINTQLLYIADSGSFFSSRIDQISTRIFSSLSNQLLFSGTSRSITIMPKDTISFTVNADLQYFADFPTEQTIYDLFRKCAPSNATILPPSYLERNGDLVLRIESSLKLGGYRLVGSKPKVTNSLYLNCPK
ncbi:hypothetical protein AYI68_g3174 [Smittium mucronatum]|uniref:Late embryogenesis abundant protein LEA-2 subgroup domain-containing protein n=1 Tax=Smittium mucronatum TaxID=133383 RepID=A0A1R0H0N7_9FUNG|nr:hypothetical protein AYI68_g3174 [Smittium mucronatum]